MMKSSVDQSLRPDASKCQIVVREAAV